MKSSRTRQLTPQHTPIGCPGMITQIICHLRIPIFHSRACPTQDPTARCHLRIPYPSSVPLKAGTRHEHPRRGLVVRKHQSQPSHRYRTMHHLCHRRQIFILVHPKPILPRSRAAPTPDLNGTIFLLSLPSLFLHCKHKLHTGARVLMNDGSLHFMFSVAL